MDPSSSFQPVSDTKTSQSSMTLDEALANLRTIVGISAPAPNHFRAPQSLHQQHATYNESQSLDTSIAQLYEQLLFSRSRNLIPTTPETIRRPLYFLPNTKLSLEGISQQDGMKIHVFTTSDSKEIQFDKIVSMVIESSLLDNISENTQRALEFLNKLFKNSFNNLRNLKFSGFRASKSLCESLSTLEKLDWLHWTYSLSDYFGHSFLFFSGLKKLHLELGEGFPLNNFPHLPGYLEELSLHFSNLNNYDSIVCMDNCISLRKM